MSSSPDYRFYAAWLLIGSLLSALLWWLAPVLTPFLIAAVIAYVLSPLLKRLESFCGPSVPRFVLVLLCESVFLMLLVAFVALIVPVLFKEATRLQAQLPVLLAQLQTTLAPLLQSFGVEIQLDPQGVKEVVAKQAQALWHNGMDSVLASLRIGGSVALALIGNLVLVPVALFYLLMDGHHLLGHMREWLPRKAEPSVSRFVAEADTVLGEYVRGQLLVMCCLSVYYVAGMSLFGLSVAWPIGILTGMAVFVPYVGFGVGLLLAALSGFLEMPPMQASLMLAVVFGLGQLLEGFVLTPRLIGERIGLHPLVVIFALLAFGQLLGFVGVLIALPASAVLLVALRRLRERYFASRLYAG
ncbi:MAG: AI-2E family transporter [Betaproteobacteria bacterium]|jgi:predicted PurR-regulated permease PerM|nr:AI-2E family transporter [Betaproteobacteria bacterium]